MVQTAEQVKAKLDQAVASGATSQANATKAYNLWLSQNNTAQPTAQPKPATQPIAQPQGLNTEQQQRLDQVKSSPVYQDMIKKGLTEEQIVNAVSQYKPTNPVETPVQPQAKTQPATPPATATQTPAKYDGLQGDVELKDIEGSTTGIQLYKGYADYQDESQRRLQEIASNVKNFYTTNPEVFSNYDTFKNFFSYNDRVGNQKQVLDSFRQVKTKGDGLATKGINDLLCLYTNGGLSSSDLDWMKSQNPSKYNELMGLINKKTELAKYDEALNETKSENPFQSIINNYTANMLSMAGTSSNMFAEYKAAMNSTEMKDMRNGLAELEGEMRQLDEQMNNIRRNVEARYEGTGASRGKINAIIQDEIWKLQEARSALGIEYQTLASKYNNQMSTIKDGFEMQIKEQEFNNSQRNQQMQEMGFMMNLMNFETNDQRDERERNKFIRQQEYVDGNIYSTDPKTRQRAVEKAVDRVLAEFQGIPMIRSREQMIADIQRMVDNGKELGEAITENIRKPIMDKPEYKKWVNDKFGIDTSKNLVNIGGVDYLMDKQGNFSLPTLPGVGIDLGFIKAGDLSGLASQYPGEASFQNNNPAGLTWGVSNELKNLWKQAGINITQGTSRPANEGGAYIKFDTIEDGIKAYDIAMTQRRGNATVKTYLNGWGTGTVGLPDNILNKKVKDLSAEEKKSVQNAQIKKESPGLYNYLQGKSQGTTETGQSNIVKSGLFDATFETYFEQQKKITSLGTEKDRQAIFASMGINSYTDFQRLANERKANKPVDEKTIQLLAKLDSLEKGVKTFGPRSLEVSINPDLKADYNFIKSNLSLESLQAAKAKGATFGAMSNAEWKILGEAATALSPRLSSNKFQEEIQNIRNQIYENYPSLKTQGTPSTQRTFDYNQYFGNLVNNQGAGNVQDNDISFILGY